MDKQIEEMAKDIIDVETLTEVLWSFDIEDIAEVLYNAGYRKQREGEWVYQEYSMGHYVGKCSLCECEADMTKYCPNCGAKMKNATDNNVGHK